MNLKELRKLIKEDREFENRNFTDDELFIVYRYINLRDLDEDPDYKPELRTVADQLEIVFVPKGTYGKTLERERKLANISTLGTDNYLLEASLVDFVLIDEERKEAYLRASRFIEAIKSGQTQKGLFLHGSYGTGKTFLLSCMVHELAKFKKVVFVYFPDLVRYIKSTIQTNELEAKIKELKMTDILVIDDVGSENMSAWFRDEVLSPVLQFRLASSLPVLISSNFTQKDLVEFFAEEKDGIGMVKASRVVHRIRELTSEVPLKSRYL
ncbi:MAG: ATP-binding protein [Acholeplasmataceae bacterium]|jgi:primosomal protein DnaI|nr:ATP-binding protein [Acholeplasmataceae bacterium]